MLNRDCYASKTDGLLAGSGTVSVLKAALFLGLKGLGEIMVLNYLIVY